MKLEEKMLVRTEWGIYKIDGIDDLHIEVKDQLGYRQKINLNAIKKASFNLIDLIEVGDFVNGIEVIKIYTTARDNKRHQGIMKKDIDFGIKEILTKEQYEANCYKIKEGE